MTPRDLPKALLVDLDDTILADSESVEECWTLACGLVEGQGLPFGAVDLLRAVDAASKEYWSDPDRHRTGRLELSAARRHRVEEALATLGRPDPDLAREVGDRYTALRKERLRIFPGAREALGALRERGVRMALVTNGHPTMQRPKIERFDLAPFFERIQIEGEVGFGKPEERSYRHALDSLGVRPEEAWMVGDNLEWDVAAPQRVGIRGIWVDHRGTGLPPGTPVAPDRIVRAFAELAG